MISALLSAVPFASRVAARQIPRCEKSLRIEAMGKVKIIWLSALFAVDIGASFAVRSNKSARENAQFPR